MKIYSVPVTIYATAYVKADSAETALAMAKGFSNTPVQIMGDDRDMFCGLAFDNPCLPDMSLSPAVTIADVENDAFVEEVE